MSDKNLFLNHAAKTSGVNRTIEMENAWEEGLSAYLKGLWYGDNPYRNNQMLDLCWIAGLENGVAEEMYEDTDY